MAGAMTTDLFLRQYEAQGRDKADGYSPADFAEMTDDERITARDMMLKRALAGDTVDLMGLRYVGDAGTVVALRQAASLVASFDWRWDVIRHDVLFDLTHDKTYLFDLAKYLDGRDGRAQEGAANALAGRVLPRDAEPFLVDRMCDGRHEGALFGLMQAWLGLRAGAVCDPMCLQRHLPLLRSVTGAAPARRRQLLAADIAA